MYKRQLVTVSPTSAKDNHWNSSHLSSTTNGLLREGGSLPFMSAVRHQYRTLKVMKYSTLNVAAFVFVIVICMYVYSCRITCQMKCKKMENGEMHLLYMKTLFLTLFCTSGNRLSKSASDLLLFVLMSVFHACE